MHDVESTKKSTLTDELLTKDPAPEEPTSPTSEPPPSRKQNLKDFFAGFITGCGVAGV